jgi:hypothetical protein
VAVFGPVPHFYGQVDFDAVNDGWGGSPTGRLTLPLASLRPTCFPLYPAGYGNGSLLEGRDHALLYPVLPSPETAATDDRPFDVSNLEALLRYGEMGSAGLSSELTQLCPASLVDARVRRLLTTHSSDLPQPGAAPWLYDPKGAAYGVSSADPEGAPRGPASVFPSLALRLQPPPLGSDFGLDWRALLPVLDRLDLNQPLSPFPHQGSGSGHAPGPPLVGPHDRFDTPLAFDQFQTALFERQQFADRLYRLFLAVTKVPAPVNPGSPTPAELMTRRWLAQLAVNIVDFLDEDDLSTPFNFYTEQDAYPHGRPTDEPPFSASAGAPDAPRYWVFGTELPHVLVNEALAEYQASGGTANVWVELCNPFAVPAGAANIQALDRLPVPLGIPPLAAGQASISTSGTAAGYAAYQVVLANRVGPGPHNDNVLGQPDAILSQTEDADFTAPGQRIDGQPQPPGATVGAVPYLPVPGTGASMSFLLVGPPNPDAQRTIVAGLVPNETPFIKTSRLRNVAISNGSPVTVALRRLANPHLPPDPYPTVPGPAGAVLVNTWYNPYVTIDALRDVPLRNTTSPGYASYGKQQPYAADPSQCGDQRPAASSQKTQHTFGRVNRPLPPSGHYDWLVHLDRQLISPAELLHVAGCQPYQLTQRFLTGSAPEQRFTHRAPWLDQNTRLYRALEFLETRCRAAGLADVGRLPGKINLNTVWDVETLLALLDPQPGNGFTEDDVRDIFARLLAGRSPDGRPGPNDRPFRSLATGPTLDGAGIESTLLRSYDETGRRLFQPGLPSGTPADDPRRHPYVQYELLTKLFNQVTTRSNVFAVWVTVGFFAVTDATARPVKLGAEIGRAEGRPVRHRLFAIVDRTGVGPKPRPVASFDPAEDRAVLYRSVVE